MPYSRLQNGSPQSNGWRHGEYIHFLYTVYGYSIVSRKKKLSVPYWHLIVWCLALRALGYYNCVLSIKIVSLLSITNQAAGKAVVYLLSVHKKRRYVCECLIYFTKKHICVSDNWYFVFKCELNESALHAFMPLRCRNPLLLFSWYRFDLIFGLWFCKSLFPFCFWKKKHASHLEKRPQSLCIWGKKHNMTCSSGGEDVTHAERPGLIWHTHLNVCSVFTTAEISKCQNWIIYQGNTFQRGQWWGDEDRWKEDESDEWVSGGQEEGEWWRRK